MTEGADMTTTTRPIVTTDVILNTLDMIDASYLAAGLDEQLVAGGVPGGHVGLLLDRRVVRPMT